MTQTTDALTDKELVRWKSRAYTHPHRTDPKWDLDRRYIATIEAMQTERDQWKARAIAAEARATGAAQ